MKAILTWRSAMSFLSDDKGLVTTERVAIAASVVVMGIGVASVIEPKVNAAAVAIGSNLLSVINTNS